MRFFIVLGLLGLGFLFYAVIPNLYYRNKSPHIVKRFNSSNSIFLTFDDGPDIRYTLELLDLLKDYNIKATFFMVAEKMEENCNIVNRMISEGHGLGIHSYSHKSAWLSFPWQTKKDFKKSLKIFKKFNYSVEYFRPPWGTFNLLTHYYCKKYGLKTILWTLNAKDWSKKTTPDYIINKILDNIEFGHIIVLHDSNGAENAPRNTIKALETIIPSLIERGFNFKIIDDGIRSGVNE
jgi:peptidoglycan/xylan/chitin deacetylase (PgdA/CDA1 family)